MYDHRLIEPEADSRDNSHIIMRRPMIYRAMDMDMVSFHTDKGSSGSRSHGYGGCKYACTLDDGIVVSRLSCLIILKSNQSTKPIHFAQLNFYNPQRRS